MKGKRVQAESHCLGVCSLHDAIGLEWSYIDDTTGRALNGGCVTRARADELKSFREMGVCVYVKREVAKKDNDYKLVGARRVYILNNDEVNSRLVVQEFARKNDRGDLSAAPPPLATTKLVLSQCSSLSKHGCGDHRLMILDVKRAFLYGDLDDSIYINLPDEDPMGL